MKGTILLCLILSIVISVVFAANHVHNGIVIDDVQRSIDASKSNVVRQTIAIKLINAGSSEADFFHFALPKEFGRNHLSYLKATQSGKALKITDFGYEDKHHSDAIFYQIQLDSPLAQNQKVELIVTLTLTNGATTPFPKEIEQSENQKLIYNDNAYFYSPYAVSSQKTTVELGTSIIDSFTNDVKPSERRGTTIVYGTYTNQKPFAYNKVKIHYQNNNPYVVVSKVERLLEISHWGNIAVEEQYDVRHGGAKFKGSFSRSDYARNPAQTAPASFNKLTAKLPSTAADVYFRDRIGNISTSEVRTTSRGVEVDFLPRFPLFGGWRIRFTIGYNLPTPDFLSYSGDQYKLTAKFSVPFDFAPVDDLTLRVVLPEGATNIKTSVPFALDAEYTENLKTYLDIEGRTVVVLKKTKLSPEHNQDVVISYTFASHNIFREPLMVVGGLFAFCLFMIAYVRVDMTIYKSEAAVEEDRETKIVELTEEFLEKQLTLSELYSSIEKSIQRIRRDDSSIFDSELEKMTSVRESILRRAGEIIANLNSIQASDISSKIKNVLSLDETKFNTARNLATAKKEALQSNKNNADIAKALKPSETKYDQVSDDIQAIIDQLSE